MKTLPLLFRTVFLLLTACWLAGLPQNVQAQSAERQKVILVLDASGSMWGQIDGVSKIEIARAQIGDMLGTWDADTDLGLMAYGHRQKGACEDIELVVEPGPLNADAFRASVNAISPKGKTPLSDAVRQAAEAMRFTEERATVILLSDGLENCQADPCALAAELEGQGIDFTAHVIGFDVAETEAEELSCLAEETGGQFFLAGDADTLTASLKQTVATIAAEPEPEPKVVVAEPEPEPEPQGPFGIRARVKMCENCDILTDNVFWWLQEPEQDINGKRKELERSAQADSLFEVAPGDYYLTVRVGSAFGNVNVAVAEKELADTVVVLEAGNMRVRAEASEGGTSLEDDMFYWVFEAKQDLNGDRKEVVRSAKAQEIFTLSEGEYLLRARHGSAFQDVPFEIKPGELTDIVVAMNVAYLRVNAIPTAGAEPLTDDMFYWVFEQATDLQGNRKEIVRSAQNEPVFKLPAGDYLVRARHGNAFADVEVSVSADTLTTETFNMNVGYLRLSGAMAEGLAPLNDALFYWVQEAKQDLNGKRKEIALAGQPNPLFKLPEGDYNIVVRNGSAFRNFDVSVKAGQLTEQAFVLDTGLLVTSAALTEDTPALTNDVFWWLLKAETDLNGNRAEQALAGQATARFIAPAGEYVLRVRHAGEFYEFPVALSPGEQQELTVVLKK
ncbi:MAG: VWA domain-containing protein [Paracoccaceae bacterium]